MSFHVLHNNNIEIEALDRKIKETELAIDKLEKSLREDMINSAKVIPALWWQRVFKHAP